MRQRRTFTAEYKAEVVKMVADSGKSPRTTALELGLTPSAVTGWVRQAAVDAKGKGTDSMLTTEERAELGRLRKENRDLRMEREFLKKMSAFFARESA